MNNKIQHKTQCTACGNIDLLQDSLMGESVKILDADKAKEIREEAIKGARESMNLEFQDLKAQIAEKDAAVQKATEIELNSRKRERAVEEKQVHLDLEIEKRLRKKTEEIREKVQLQADEKYRSTIAMMEKEKKDIEKKLVETTGAIRNPSQQLQGEAFEEVFEDNLRATFPLDNIEPIPQGTLGADIKQTVHNDIGQVCGTILHELKETKGWSSKWIDKLKGDVEVAGADIGILVTKKLPSGVIQYTKLENIRVVEPTSALMLIDSIRDGLCEAAFAKNANVNVEKRMGELYEHLTSPKFRHSMQNQIQNDIQELEALNTEERVMNRIWKGRRKRIKSRMLLSTTRYSDIKAIMGNKIEDIPELELDSLEMLTDGTEEHDEAA